MLLGSASHHLHQSLYTLLVDHKRTPAQRFGGEIDGEASIRPRLPRRRGLTTDNRAATESFSSAETCAGQIGDGDRRTPTKIQDRGKRLGLERSPDGRAHVIHVHVVDSLCSGSEDAKL